MTDDEGVAPHAYLLLGYDINKAVDIARDQENIGDVFRRVFGTIEGKAVLFDMMARAHMGEMRSANMTDRERAYMDGWAAMVIEVLNLAGVDPYERVAALHIADTLPVKPMERTHDGRHAKPDAEQPASGGWEPGPNGF